MTVRSHYFTGKRVPRWLAGTTAAAIVLLGLPALTLAPANAAIPATGGLPNGFEIDGDFVLNNGGTADWATVSSLDGFTQTSDPVGSADASVFSASSKESDPPSTWTTAPGTAPGKTDIGGIWTYKTNSVDASGPHSWTYLAWDRASGSGTNYFYLEFNAKPNATSTSPKPTRSVGDVRLVIHSLGNGLLNLDEADSWNGSAWVPKAAPAGSFYGAVNVASVALPSGFSSPNAVSGSIPVNQFYEVGFDLGALGLLPKCPSPGFGTANFRAATGEAPDNLKDYVEPISIDIPSTCALVTVSKVATGDTYYDDGTTTNFPLIVSGTGVKPSSPQTLQTKAGATSGPVTVDPGVNGTQITVSEGATPTNWSFLSTTCKVDGKTATDASGDPGFQVNVKAFQQVACVITNTITAPAAQVKVTKTWTIDGVSKTDAEASALGFVAHPTITGDNAPTGTLAFGEIYSGFKAGKDVTIGETYSGPADCQNVQGGQTGTHTLVAGLNTYALTNTVICDAAIQVNKLWTIDGVNYTNDTLPATFTKASLTLDGAAKSFGQPYPGYHTGDKVVVAETVTLPTGCSYVTGYPTGAGTKTLARGLNTYEIVNNVVCPATVTVNKVWVVDGVTSALNTPPTGFSVVPTVSGTAVALGQATAGYHRGQTVTIGEKDAVAPSDCTVVGGPTGDVGAKTLVTGSNVYTITNTYKCAATVKVNKVWNVDGVVYANGSQPAGLSASLTLTGQGSPTFGGGPYTGYFTGDKVTVGETTSLSGCTVSSPATGLGEKTLVRGLNTYTVTNFVSCKATLAIQKFDADTGAPVSGGTFVLHQDNKDGATVGTCTITAPATSCSVPNIGLGTYVWVETVPPTGYQLPANPVSDPVTVTPANSGTTIMRSFSDPQTRTTIKVIKLDATSKAPLAGAGFTVYLDNGDGSFNPATDALASTEQLTDAQGVTNFVNLKFGTYWVVETTAPFGYLLSDPSVVKVVITAANAGVTQTLTFENPRKTSRITVIKKDKDTGSLLAGFTFGLRTSVGGADIKTCTTGEGGSCTFSNIDFGTYYVVETAQAAGYQADAPAQGPFVVDASNAGNLVATVTFLNSEIRSSLSVLKIDDVTKAPLAGAEFDLRSGSADGKVVGSCTTGADGTCSVGGLLFGTYVWVETKAPAGYGLPTVTASAPIVITAANAGSTFTAATFADPMILTDLKVAKLDASNQAPLSGATFELRVGSATGTLAGTCTTGADGTCSVTGLRFGTYVWVETKAPVGYTLPANPVSAPITVDATNAGTTFATTSFSDPRILTDLTVKKVDAADATKVLGGAKFELRKDNVDGAAVFTCTTPATGLCTATGLTFGTYVWVETQAPAGYLLPADTVSAPIVVTAANAGTTFPVTVFADPGIAVPGISKVAMQDDAVISDSDTENPKVGTVDTGSTIHYVVTVSNTGTAVAEGPVTDVLPAGLDTPSNISNGGTFAGGTITWASVTVPAGGSVVLSYDAVVLLKAAEPEFNTLVNKASWLTVTASTTTLVRPLPPTLAPTPNLKKTADPATGTAVERGDVITYTIKAGNTGTGPAVGDVVDTLPVGVTPVDGSYTKDGAAFAPTSVTATTITWAGVAVAAGQTVTFTYQVTVNSDATANLVNKATWMGLTSSTTHPVTIPELPQTGASIDPVAGALWSALLLALGVMFLVFGRRKGQHEG